jgi:hypothetical protein
MGRLPFLPDPERLQGLWSASGVEAADQRRPPPASPGRIRFSASPPAPAPPLPVAPVAPPPRDPVAGLQRAAVPAPPPAPALPARPVPPGVPIQVGARAPVGPPLPPRVPGPPAPPLPLAAAAAAPAPVPVPAAPAAPVAPPRPAVPQVPDEALAAQIFGNGSNGIDARLQRLLEYTGKTLQASSAFVADSDGLTVAGLRSSEALAAVTAPLGGVQEKIAAFVPASAEGGAVVELDEQGVLQLVWAATAAGRLALGMVLQSPLDRASTRKLRRLVQMAVDTKGSV